MQLWCWLRGKSIHLFIRVVAEYSTDGQNAQIHVVIFFELHSLIDISHATTPVQGDGESLSPSAKED